MASIVLYLLCALGAMFAFAVTVIMGLWDGIVWLTKSDWRTTNFSVPLIAFVAAIVLGISARVINDLIEHVEKVTGRKEQDDLPPEN